MAENNSTILNSVWLKNSNDFQQRIPQPTQTSISQTVDALFDPMNRSYFNDFMNVLINRIAFTYVRGQVWKNKLAVFKGQKINYGSTIQEIAPNWVRAHAYNVEDETLLKLKRPEAAVWYHSQNRQDRYDISVSFDDMRTAFTDEYGLNNLIARIMETPINSDEYDEYRIMLELIAEYDNAFGFFKKQISAVTSDATAKAFLKELRTDAMLLEFPSARYNAANVDIPVFAKNPELVIFMLPSVKASIDVDALASVFNLNKADVEQRIIIVDEFPIPNVQAILTTEDFFVCHDTVYENTSFWNPQTLSNNYYLHHWGIYSVSPFVPCIVYTTGSGSGVDVVTQTISALSMTPATKNASAGDIVQFTLELTGSLSSSGSGDYSNISVAPDSATFELSAIIPGDATADPPVADEPVQLDIDTYVDKYGRLHISKDIPVDTEITVTATSTYINPSGSTSSYTDTSVVTIV